MLARLRHLMHAVLSATTLACRAGWAPAQELVCPSTRVFRMSVKANDHPPPITTHTYPCNPLKRLLRPYQATAAPHVARWLPERLSDAGSHSCMTYSALMHAMSGTYTDATELFVLAAGHHGCDRPTGAVPQQAVGAWVLCSHKGGSFLPE
jgi:hypothetical protein